MIGALRTWLLSIIAAGLVLSILYALLPKGRLRPIVRTAGGVVLMLVILRPLTELDLEGFAVSYDDYAREIRELTEQYRAADTAELAAIIERETAAYISDKGAALGVNCHAVVETELRSGVPYPCAVTLDVERNETLAACIAADLGIGKGLAGGWGEVTYEAGEMDGTAEEVPICGADRAGGDGTDAAAHRRQQGGQRG